MSEEYMILMDHLDSLFDQLSKHDWKAPLWMLRELRLIKSAYDRINSESGVEEARGR